MVGSNFCDHCVDALYLFLFRIACWTVFNEGRNIVRLDNYRNFLAIENGVLVVKSYVSIMHTSTHDDPT